MLYQEYKNKMLKLVRILETIRKFRFLIISLTCSIIVLTASFLITKGLVISPSLEKTEVEYGEAIEVHGNALFGKQWLEYKYGNGEWSTTQTYEIGEHHVRVVAKSAFGKNRYSKELKYVINPRKTEVEVYDESITYGDMPTVKADRLADGDKITCSAFIWNFELETTPVSPKEDSIVITNKDGIDVTKSYDITIKNGERITFEKKPITITVKSDQKNYDGTELKAPFYYTEEDGKQYKIDLAFKDYIDQELCIYPSQTEVGEVDNFPTPTFVIKNEEGKDVTARYDITVVKGILTVNKRPITIHTQGGTFTYNDEDFSNKGFTVDEATLLLDGHKIEVLESTAVRNVCKDVENVFTKIIITDKDGNDVTDCYEISYVNGMLEVIKRDVTITTKTQSWVYDGKEHFDVEFTQQGLVERDELKHTLEPIDKTVLLNATEPTTNIVTYDVYSGDVKVTENYNIKYEYGTLEVTKRPLELKSKDQSHQYDDTEFTGSEYEIVSGSLAEEQSIIPTYTAKITDAGEVDNTFEAIIKHGELDVTENYELTITFGKLTVTKRPIAIAGAGASKEYDGKELRNEAYVSRSALDVLPHHIVKFVKSASIVDAGAIPNNIEIEIYDANDVPKTDNYEITYDTPENLVVSKRLITITANSMTAIYNGKDRSDDGYVITGSGIAEEQYEFVTIEGSRKNVGTTNNVITDVVIKDKNLEVVTYNYDITCIDGTITIEPRPVTFVSNGASKVYDAYPLTVHTAYEDNAPEYENTGLVEGQKAKYTFTGTITDVLWVDGEVSGVDNTFTATIWEGDEETTSNYTITYKYSTLIIHPRPISFISEGAEKIYDASPLTHHAASISETIGLGLADNPETGNKQSVYYAFTGTLTDVIRLEDYSVGSAFNTFTATIGYGTKDTTANYDISYIYGHLFVNPRPIQAISGTSSRVYNGLDLSNTIVTFSEEAPYMKLVSHHDYYFLSYATLNDVGAIQNVIEIGIEEDYTGVDKTHNYDISYIFGTLTVIKRSIKIVTDSDEKMYDGTPLVCQSFTYNEGYDYGLAYGMYGQRIELEITGSITFAGQTYNTIKQDENGNDIVNILDGEKNVTHNYDITTEYGTLTVTKRPISITADDREKEYDGTPLYGSDPAIVGKEGLAVGDTLTATYIGSQTIPGSSPVGIGSFKITRDGMDVTFCYETPSEDIFEGTLTVLPRKISITANSDEKIYDNTPLTNSGYSDAVGMSGLVDGHRIYSVNVEGSIIDAGVADNVPSDAIIVDGNGNNVTPYYEITYINGTLEVLKRKITVSTIDGEAVYNGLPFSKPEGELVLGEGDGMLYGEALTINVTGMGIDAGEYDNTFVVEISKANGDDSTNNYEVTEELGTLTIKPLELYFYTGSSTKVYDGTALTNSEYSLDSNSRLISSHMFGSIETTGSQLVAGSSKNTIKVTVVRADDPSVDVTKNYEVKGDFGDLVVTKATITIATGSASKPYDGEPLTCEDYSFPYWSEESSKLLVEHNIMVKTTGYIIEIGTEPNPFDAKIMNGDLDVTESFIIKEELGTLEITAPPLTFASESSEKTYDGTPLTWPHADIKYGSLFEGHKAVYDFTGTELTNVARDEFGRVIGVDNYFTVKIVDENGQDVTDMYPNIGREYGTLRVEPVDLTIESPSEIKQYDGTPLEAPLYVVEPNADLDNLNQGYDEPRFTWEVLYPSASITEKGSLDYKIIIDDPERGSAFQIYFDGEPVPMTNFDIKVEEGTLRVVEKLLRINLFDVSKTYDGTPISYEPDDWYILPQNNPDGLRIMINLHASITDAGAIDKEELAEELLRNGDIQILDENGVNITENYAIVFDGEPLRVNRLELHITVASAHKEYDGNPLTAESFALSFGTLMPGHYFDDSMVVYTGKITEVGSIYNRIQDIDSLIIRDKNGVDVTENYYIIQEEGMLTIEKSE